MSIQPANAAMFQAFNACFLVSYATTDALSFRIIQIFACLCLTFWWAFFLDLFFLDGVIWGVAFVVINFYHFCLLLYKMRPVKIRNELEDAYKNIFEGSFSRLEFNELVDKKGFMRSIKKGGILYEEGNPFTMLAILLTGTMSVTKKTKSELSTQIGIVKPKYFLSCR